VSPLEALRASVGMLTRAVLGDGGTFLLRDDEYMRALLEWTLDALEHEAEAADVLADLEASGASWDDIINAIVGGLEDAALVVQ